MNSTPNLINSSSNLPTFYAHYLGKNNKTIVLDLVLPASFPNTRKFRRIRHERDSDEIFSVTLQRITTSIEAMVDPNLIQTKSAAVSVSLLVPDNYDQSNDPVSTDPEWSEVDPGQITVKDAVFASKLPIFLRVDLMNADSLLFKCSRDPARILSCSFRTKPMVGFPLAPTISQVNTSLKNSDFEWFVSKTSKWPDQPCHVGYIFTPSHEHLGCQVQLRIRPRDHEGNLGIPFGHWKYFEPFGSPVICKWPVQPGPTRMYHSSREKQLETSKYRSQLRLVTYNLLADMYAYSDYGKSSIFRHCPLECLDHRYRQPLILQDLFSFKATFLCLQEVDTDMYRYYLKQALLSKLNLHSIFMAKRSVVHEPEMCVNLDREKAEGCAIFYDASSYELVSQHHLPSLLAYAEQDPLVGPLLAKYKANPPTNEDDQQNLPEFFKSNFYLDSVKSYAHCLAAGLFRYVGESNTNCTKPHMLVVGSTHLYFHPMADMWRYLQALSIREYLNHVAENASVEHGLPVSIVVGGDINQSPTGPAFDALLSSASSNNSRPLHTAYSFDAESFTNWVPNFKASLDMIFYSKNAGLKCTYTMPLCSQTEIVNAVRAEPFYNNFESRGEPIERDEDEYALPNAHFPSDHLPLVADFVID